MKIQLFLALLAVSCSCLSANSAVPVSLTSLAEEAFNELQDPTLVAALQALDDVTAAEEIDSFMFKQALGAATTALLQARKDTGCKIQRRAAPSSCVAEHATLLNKIDAKLRLLSLTLQRQQEGQKRAQECPTSMCNTPTNITALGTTITAPGHYCVLGDLSYSGPGPAITITSSDVELSLDLRTITLSGTATIGILVDGTGSTISNIHIGGCGVINNASVAGIQVNGAEDVSIDGILINSSAVGIQIIDSDGVTMNRVDLSTGGIGLQVTAPDVQHESINVKIVDSVMRGNAAEGMSISFLTDNLEIDNCFIADNGGSGIFLQAASQLNQVQISDTFLFNNQIGLNCGFGVQNVLVQELIINESISDGILLENTANITLANCLLSNNGGRGVHTGYGVRNLIVKDCEVLNSAQSPFEAVGLMDAVIEESLFGTTAANQVAGMILAQSGNCIIKDCLIYGFVQDPTAPLDPSINLITGTNGLTLQNCHGVRVENCVVGTNGMTNNSIDGAAILLYGGNRDCTIQSCSLYNDPTQPASRGIAVFDAPLSASNSGITIEGNTIQGATRHGILIKGLEDSRIQNNTISATSNGTGMTVKCADGLTILSNIIMNNAHHGLHIEKQVKNSAIRDNTVYANGKVGIAAHQKKGSCSDANTVYHNFSYSNQEENFRGVTLVVKPKRHVGVLENISG